MRDIEGKAAREAASECGQRASFNLYVLNSYFFLLPLSAIFRAPSCSFRKDEHQAEIQRYRQLCTSLLPNFMTASSSRSSSASERPKSRPPSQPMSALSLHYWEIGRDILASQNYANRAVPDSTRNDVGYSSDAFFFLAASSAAFASINAACALSTSACASSSALR
jgi:hypothetical protein